MASAHDWSLVNITGSSSSITHLRCVLSLARSCSPSHSSTSHFSLSLSPTFSVLFILLAKQMSADWSSPVRVYGGWDWLEKKKKKGKKGMLWPMCRRETFDTCHVVALFWLFGRGGEGELVIMCCVVHSGLEGQINKESGSLFAAIGS